jgi:hypothetical protein
VADAVDLEPVSTAKFPANREKNREFRQIGPLRAILKADARANSEACSEIPYATEQGIISEEQGILAREQGIFTRHSAERFADDVFGSDNYAKMRRRNIVASSASWSGTIVVCSLSTRGQDRAFRVASFILRPFGNST